MESCLYCNEVARSEEHPLSAALGEFKDGPTLIDRICKKCNEQRIGLLDEQFIRCGPAAILRKRFEIEGRQHHNKVNPFYRGSAGGKRIKFLAWDDSFQCDVLVELTGGQKGRQLTQLILRGQSGPHHHIPLTASTTSQALREQIAALQLVAPLELRLIYDPPTEHWAVELFKELWPGVEPPATTLGATRFNGGIIQFETTNRYFRAIAKIGFHYFLTQFPKYTGREPIFEEIRDFIISDTKELTAARINKFIGIHQLPLAPPSTGFVAHLLCAEIRGRTCLADFEPFVTPNGRMQAFQVRLGVDLVREEFDVRSHIYLYYGRGKVGRYSGDAHRVDLDRIGSSSLEHRVVLPAFGEGLR